MRAHGFFADALISFAWSESFKGTEWSVIPSALLPDCLRDYSLWSILEGIVHDCSFFKEFTIASQFVMYSVIFSFKGLRDVLRSCFAVASQFSGHGRTGAGKCSFCVRPEACASKNPTIFMTHKAM
jgi:hypothetical protein